MASNGMVQDGGFCIAEICRATMHLSSLLLVTYYLLFIFKFTLYNMKIILLFKFKLRYKNQWWFGTKLPPNIHTMTVQDILQRKLDPSFRKSIVATIRSWQWPKESNHQNHSSYNYLRSCWEFYTNHSTDLKQKEKTACELAENPHIHHFDLYLLIQKVCSLSDCRMWPSAQPLDQEAPEHSSKTNLHQKQVAIRPDGLLYHQCSEPWQNAIWEVCSEN